VRLEHSVILPLKGLKAFATATILSVPGNHDLDCEIGLPISWEKLGATRQQEFFASSEAGVRLRSQRAAAFKEYEKFAERANILTCNPTQRVVENFVVTSSGGSPLDVICVNTALFSDKDVSDERLAQAPVDALREVFAACANRQPAIVLGHHPL